MNVTQDSTVYAAGTSVQKGLRADTVIGQKNNPVITETQKGSTGLSGTFTIDYDSPTGSRTVYFQETAERFEFKLEEIVFCFSLNESESSIVKSTKYSVSIAL